MGAATMASRLLGLVREQVYAHFMGAGAVASAFQFAFTLPNLFRRLLGEGVLSAAFIPIFKAKEKTEGQVAMWRASNAVISGVIAATSMLASIVLIGISVVLACCNLNTEWRLMLELLRVMFPYVMLVCLTAIAMGILNARGHFFIPAMGASILNVVMIASVLWLAPHIGKNLETQIFALAVGVLVAGVAQLAFQCPSLRREGYRFEWINPWRDPVVREVARKMTIGSIGVAAFQINVSLTQCMAFGENAPIVSIFAYATRLMELPQGVIGISLATYLLPTLSGLAIEKKYGEFRSTLRQGMGYLIFANLIASILLVVLAKPIVRLVFQHGKFTAVDTDSVSLTLMLLAPGLVAFSMVNILARAFYALDDIMTPMKVSVFCLATNLILTAFLLFAIKMDAAGLALANTITSLFNVSLLILALRKKLKRLELADLLRQLPPILAAGATAGLAAWIVQVQWDCHLGHATLMLKLGHVFVPALLAGVIYLAITLSAKVRAAQEVIGLAGSRLKWKGRIRLGHAEARRARR